MYKAILYIAFAYTLLFKRNYGYHDHAHFY